MNVGWLSLLALIAGFWPVWSWYLERLSDKSDEPLGIIALLALAFLLFFRVKNTPPHNTPSTLPSASSRYLKQFAWLIPAAVYIGTFTCAPKLLKAVLAISTLVLYVPWQFPALSLGFADLGLTLMSLPAVASINFYLGYPARLFSCWLAKNFLNILGTKTEQFGTALSVGSSIVEVDAPCSGLKMLWFAWCTALILCSLHRFSFLQTTIMLGWALLLSMLANAVRVTSLFFLETGQITLHMVPEDIIHQTIGALSFLAILSYLVLIVPYIEAVSTVFPSINFRSLNQNLKKHLPGQLASDAQSTTVTPQPQRNQLALLLPIVLVLAIMPLFNTPSQLSSIPNQEPIWPKQFHDSSLQRLPLTPQQQRFLQGFPGHSALFQAGSHQILIRHVTVPTRQLHPAIHCFAGNGYTIVLKPIKTDTQGQRWGCFEATKDGQKTIVEERLFDEQGHNYTDVSTWYWQAIFGHTRAPWWSYTVIKPAL